MSAPLEPFMRDEAPPPDPRRDASVAAEGEGAEERFVTRLALGCVEPLRYGGWATILTGAAAFWLAVLVIGWIASWFESRVPGVAVPRVYRYAIWVLFGVPFAGYAAGYLLHIVEQSARGQRHLPDWPNPAGAVELLQPVGLIAGVFAVTLLPAFGWRAWAGGEADAIFWVLLAAGSAYVPMALLAVSLCDAVDAIRPALVVRSILRIPGAYVLAVAALGLLVSVWVVAGPRVAAAPYVGGFLRIALAMYLLVTAAHLLGTLYHANRERLRWF